jgi:hypothetical protein
MNKRSIFITHKILNIVKPSITYSNNGNKKKDV